MGRIDSFTEPPTRLTGFFLVDSLLAGDLRLFRATAAQLTLPAITLAMFAHGAAGAHDPRLDAGRALQRFRAHGARHGPGRMRVLWSYACATPCCRC